MNVNQDRIRLFEADLRAAFTVNLLQIDDDSHLHSGHAGAASGGGHFTLTIVAREFEGLSQVARHRAVYAALKKHFPEAIHALVINASAPSKTTTLSQP